MTNVSEKKKKRQFNALYYPETICLDREELKYLLLLYDKVCFLPVDIHLNPGHNTLSSRFSLGDGFLAGAFKTKREAYYAQMFMSEPKAWDPYMRALMETYDELEEKKVFVPLTHPKFDPDTGRSPVEKSVEADMLDAEFLRLCKRHLNPKIFIPKIDDTVIKGGGFAITRPFLYHKGENAIPSVCSDRLNSALFFAEQENLFPVSPHQMYVDLLTTKIKRIAAPIKPFPEVQSLQQTRSHRFSIFSWEVMTEAIPLQAMENKSVSEILRYKESCSDLKERFRNHLLGIETSINSEPWDSGFQNELDKIVKKEVLPEIQAVRDKKTVIWESLFGESIKSLMSLKILPPLLGVHLVPGLSFGEILSLSTAAVVGTAAVPNLINAWKEERQLYRNAMFFIVNFAGRKRM